MNYNALHSNLIAACFSSSLALSNTYTSNARESAALHFITLRAQLKIRYTAECVVDEF